MKQLLGSSLIVKPFNQQLETILLEDASRLKGLGFTLMQKGKDGKKRPVHYGSKILTLCQQKVLYNRAGVPSNTVGGNEVRLLLERTPNLRTS